MKRDQTTFSTVRVDTAGGPPAVCRIATTDSEFWHVWIALTHGVVLCLTNASANAACQHGVG